MYLLNSNSLPNVLYDSNLTLLFNLHIHSRSFTFALNEKLGRHNGRNGTTVCTDENESVVHVYMIDLWEARKVKLYVHMYMYMNNQVHRALKERKIERKREKENIIKYSFHSLEK